MNCYNTSMVVSVESASFPLTCRCIGNDGIFDGIRKEPFSM